LTAPKSMLTPREETAPIAASRSPTNNIKQRGTSAARHRYLRCAGEVAARSAAGEGAPPRF